MNVEGSSSELPGYRAPRRCPVCRTLPRTALMLPAGQPLLQCPRCRLGWWPWEGIDPQALYDRDYFQSGHVARGYDDYAALEAGLRLTARLRLRRIERLRRRCGAGPGGVRGRLLEVGCASGVFLDQARHRGWETTGWEVSEYAARRARSRGIMVHTGAIEGAIIPEASWDCIALWDVIEHLRDPVGVLHSLARGLRVGGVLALSTGDVTSLCARWSGPRWHLFNLPEHLFFFSPGSLRALLEGAGLRVALTCRELGWFPASYLIERLRKTVPPLGRFLRPLRAAGGPLDGLALPATLFDVLGVYAVRRG